MNLALPNGSAFCFQLLFLQENNSHVNYTLITLTKGYSAHFAECPFLYFRRIHMDKNTVLKIVQLLLQSGYVDASKELLKKIIDEIEGN